MKRTIFLVILTLGFVLPTFSFAHGTTINNITKDEDHTAREEAEGKAIWEKLQAKELNCEALLDDDFGALGEYFMGQMMGTSHTEMNDMMTQMMGEEDEKQMHIVMGKRMSDCEPEALMPQNMMGSGMMPMMMGGWLSHFTQNSSDDIMSNMMANFGIWGWIGFIFMILFWILVIVGIVALIKWLVNQLRGGTKSKSAIDILKERYAKGEIDKKEFEEKKKI